jgi:alpha-glucosidase
LRNKCGKAKIDLFFRLFDDGLVSGTISRTKKIETIIITAENTQFHWQTLKKPGGSCIKRFITKAFTVYNTLKIDTVCTPVTLEFENGKFLAIHEANLSNYAAMNFYYSG